MKVIDMVKDEMVKQGKGRGTGRPGKIVLNNPLFVLGVTVSSNNISCPLKLEVFFVYLKPLHVGVNSNKRELIYGPTKYNAEFLGVILSSFLDIINK